MRAIQARLNFIPNRKESCLTKGYPGPPITGKLGLFMVKKVLKRLTPAIRCRVEPTSTKQKSQVS
jgi:hypothetical protein